MAITFRTFNKKWKDRKKRFKRWRKEMEDLVRFHPVYLNWSAAKAAKRLRKEGLATPKIITAIDPGDRMYKKKKAESYFDAGFQALDTINRALAEAGKGEVRAILDFACGHGRVMRALRGAWPQAQIVACDLEKEAVDYCSKTFRATPVYSAEDPDAMVMPMQFDLIWVGSLFTHLEGARWAAFLKLFSHSLAPGGVLLFSSHGELIANRARAGDYLFGLEPDALKGLLSDYQASGFAYRDYRPGCNYGTSLSRPEWVKAKVASIEGIELVNLWERGWSGYQDAVICRKPL